MRTSEGYFYFYDDYPAIISKRSPSLAGFFGSLGQFITVKLLATLILLQIARGLRIKLKSFNHTANFRRASELLTFYFVWCCQTNPGIRLSIDLFAVLSTKRYTAQTFSRQCTRTHRRASYRWSVQLKRPFGGQLQKVETLKDLLQTVSDWAPVRPALRLQRSI